MTQTKMDLDRQTLEKHVALIREMFDEHVALLRELLVSKIEDEEAAEKEDSLEQLWKDDLMDSNLVRNLKLQTKSALCGETTNEHKRSNNKQIS